MSRSVVNLRRRILAFATFLAIAPTVSMGADRPKGADWLSSEAFAYVEVSRPTTLLDRFLGEPLQGYLKTIPGYARYLRSDDYRKGRGFVDFLAATLDTTWEKGVRDLTAGGIAVGVEMVDKKPAVIVVVTPGDPAFLKKAHDKLLALARNDARSKGAPDPVKEKAYRGITGYQVAPNEAHAIIQDALVITNEPNALKLVADRALDGQKKNLTTVDAWKARQAAANGETLAWGLLRLVKLREIDPKRFNVPDQVDPGANFFFGPWIEAVRKAPWVAANVSWTKQDLSAAVVLPTPRDGYPDAFKRFIPPKGQGAPVPLRPKGVMAGFTLWRDLSSIWEVRSDLLPPQTVQRLAQLDTFAGQFFGGRDFGSDVLGAISANWRVVVASQDFSNMRPAPEVKLPAFALVIDTKPDDEDFAQRLKVAFQSFIGLVNIGSAESKAPPLELGSETVDGVTISTSRYMPPKVVADSKEPVHQRHNFSPSAARVGNHFIISSTIGLAKDLIPVLKAETKPTDETVLLQADGPEIAKLVSANRERLVMQNILDKGNDKANAETEIDMLAGILNYLGKATLAVKDGERELKFSLDFSLDSK